ncbi:MAG: cadmium-translocating P-type ATPase [Coprobacillus sp.]|nr:cadmium-translocating P-type ATPase [Coprobacillus sp.]
MSVQKEKLITNKSIAIIVRCSISLIIMLVAIFWTGAMSETDYNWFTTPASEFDNWYWITFGLYLVAYILIVYDQFYEFCVNIFKKHTFFNETSLMLIASIGAFCIQEFMEGILVMLLAQVGDILESVSINRSKNLIIDTLDTRPKTATIVLNDGSTKEIKAEDVKLGDMLMYKAGEMFVVDGKVTHGESYVDEATITGEFAPREVKIDDLVYSGTTNKEGVITIEATSTYFDSTTSKIMQLVFESKEKKSQADAFVDKFSKIYTPIVFLIAIVIALFPPLITCLVQSAWLAETWINYLYVALTCLVICCPCAIVISVPLAYFCGVSLGSKYGIIVKGGNYLDKINDIGTVVFDKTGTLTTGDFTIISEAPKDIDIDKFRELLYVGESLSTHPIGEGIVKYYNLGISNKKVKNYKEFSGKGLSFKYDNEDVLIGNATLFDEENIVYDDVEAGHTTIYLAVNNEYKGYLLLDDKEKESSRETLKILKENNIETVMLSGAKKESAEYTASQLGISEVYSNLLPDEKISYLENIINDSSKAVAYVGDGANDAPSIIMADVGFAMGSIGSDVSVENADVIIMNDEPIKVIESMRIAKMTRNRAVFNIAFTLTVKAIIFLFTLIPAIIPAWDFTMPMWVGSIADSGLAILLVISTVLLIYQKVKIKKKS